MVRYSNNTKSTWRGWAWNRISENVPKGGSVLVLCGDGAFDTNEASRRGFNAHGFDLDNKKVQLFRDQGHIAYCTPVGFGSVAVRGDAAILDWTSGMTNRTLEETVSVIRSGISFLVVNFLRGREKQRDSIFQLMKSHEVRACSAFRCLAVFNDQTRRWHFVSMDKHRGFLFLLSIFTAAFQAHVKDVFDRFDEDNVKQLLLAHSQNAEKATLPYTSLYRLAAVKDWCNEVRPQFYSYRSKDSGQWFDSVAFHTTAMQSDKLSIYPSHAVVPKSTRRRIAAARAVFTKKSAKGARV